MSKIAVRSGPSQAMDLMRSLRLDPPGGRLSLASLGSLPPAVRRPRFAPQALRPGILHLGCGAFHRAHQAVFTQAAIEAEGGATPAAWGIIGASLRSPGLRDRLARQDGLYSLLERGGGGLRAAVVGTLRGMIFAPEDPEGLLARLADPQMRIVTLTVTPSAYCLEPASGRLSPRHPDIVRDLAAPLPRSALGFLVEGLARRRRQGLRPPVVMSCDNLVANGRTLRQAALDYAALRDDRLAAWIAREVQFPGSMVDRIVPAATPRDGADAAALLGLEDAAPVATEPFRQWVIEEFDGPRPHWAAAGAEMVGDVAPWEMSKLRLLNGTHMAIGYLGALAGLRTVDEVMAEPALAAYVLRFMLAEQLPTMPPSSHDVAAYAHQLAERWRNPGIGHGVDRIGRNGSEKLQSRLLASIAENLAAGRPAPCTILAVAAWICCVTGQSGQGCPVTVEDPAAARLAAVGQETGADPQRLVAALLAMRELFGTALPAAPGFRAALVAAVASLQRHGPRGAVAALLGDGDRPARAA